MSFNLPSQPRALPDLMRLSFLLFKKTFYLLLPVSVFIAFFDQLPFLLDSIPDFNQELTLEKFCWFIGSAIAKSLLTLVMQHGLYQWAMLKKISFPVAINAVWRVFWFFIALEALSFLVSWVLFQLVGSQPSDQVSPVLVLFVLLLGGLFIWFLLRLILVPLLLVLERKTLVSAFSHSWISTRGSLLKIALMLMLPSVIAGALLGLVTGSLYGFLLTLGMEEHPGLKFFFIFVGTVFVVSLVNAFFVVLYHDLRLRRKSLPTYVQLMGNG